MHKRGLLLFAVFTFSFGLFLFIGIYWKQQNAHKAVHAPIGALKPSEEFFMVRSFPYFDEAAEGFRNAWDYLIEWKAIRKNVPPGFDTPWMLEGPTNIGGRINTIAQDPNDKNTFLVGLVAGGIFKTVNGGQHWYPVFDDKPVYSISKIVYDPAFPGTVYAATGDPNISAYVFLGQGIYKSTDGGENWSLLGLADAGVINGLAIHPTNSNILFAGCMGNVLRKGTERGLYRSDDGGASWTQTLFLSQEAGISDVLVDPAQPDIIFACGWHRVRNQYESIVNGPLAKLFRSTDGGFTWDVVTNGLPTGSNGRTGLTWSQGNVFYQVVGMDQQLQGLYRSGDHGVSWEEVPLNGLPGNVLGGFGWYFCKPRVNPNDHDDIWMLGVDAYRTRDGGQEWNQATPPWWTYEVHADKHDLIYTPEGHIILATDGGLSISEDDGLSWKRFDDIPNTQFYRIAQNMHEPDYNVGGAQDNGTTGADGGQQEWSRIYGGDGFQPAFHPQFPELFYAEWQNGNIVYSTDYGFSFESFKNGINSNDRIGWDAPYFVSVHPPHPMYFGTNKVYQNDDPFFAQWYPVSDVLTDPLEPMHVRTHVITALGESPLQAGRVIAGTGDGRVWIYDADNWGWENVTPGLPSHYVSSCQGSPTWADTWYVTHSGYRANSFVPHIHRSDDGGQTWVSIGDDLPPFGVNDLVVVPGYSDKVMFAGTDAGIYGTIDGGLQWYPLDTGMPSVPVYDMLYNPSTHRLIAGTHARSMYSIDLTPITDALSHITDSRPLPMGWKLYPNPVKGDHVILDKLQMQKNESIKIKLYDLKGRHIQTWHFPEIGSRQALEINTIPIGVYLMDIISENSRQTIKVVRH